MHVYMGVCFVRICRDVVGRGEDHLLLREQRLVVNGTAVTVSARLYANARTSREGSEKTWWSGCGWWFEGSCAMCCVCDCCLTKAPLVWTVGENQLIRV